jgi:hypothetical protein
MRDPGRQVVAGGLLLIALQLGFRAWAVFGSWFQFDDFSFMSRVMNAPLGDFIGQDYAGHLMPGGFFLTWLNLRIDPLNFALPAGQLLALQAVADLGALVFLVSAFGRRPGILAPLTVFLFSAISLPAFIWWAAGVNQMPFLAALWWAGWTHLTYLRTHRIRWALATMLITMASLAFYEKTLLIFLLFAFLPLAYFSAGDIIHRLGTVFRTYRAGVVLYALVAVGYLAVYLTYGLNYDPDRTNEVSLGPVFTNMVGNAYATGVLGGPLRWEHTTDLFAVPDPTQIVTLIAIAIVVAVGHEIARSRTCSKRAWILVALFLGADVLLVSGARVSFVGPIIALDYRYQTELAAVTAMALALASMPLRGALETVERRATSNFLDQWKRVTTAVLVVSCLALYSSVQYVQHWQGARQSKIYFQTVERELKSRQDPVPLVDVGVPDFLMWAFGYPENLTSHVLRMFANHTYFPEVATDSIYIVDQTGEITPVIIDSQRRALPPPTTGCPYPVEDGRVVVPLDGPVIGGGWWVRLGYASDTSTPVTVSAGDSMHETELLQGLHNLFFRADGEFDSIEFSGVDPDAKVCFTDLDLGLPVPYLDPADAS